MNSRRSFIKTIGSGVAVSAITPRILANTSMIADEPYQKPIRIGIIGAENSHAAGYGRMFNIDNKFSGVKVKYVWGETDEFAKKTMEKGGIPFQVQNPNDMLEKIDALIVDHRHAKYHLAAATPFVKAGIPTFIDKPFCYRASEGKEFLQMARKYGTPISSYSTVAQSNAIFDIKEQVKSIGEFSHIVCSGPVDLESEYGGLFFYGVHLVQYLTNIFGEDAERVRVTRNGKYGNASLQFSSGLFATLIFKSHFSGWETFVDTRKGMVQLKSCVEETYPAKSYTDMVEMFRTGREPRTHQSILNGVCILEALEKSAENEKWVDVNVLKMDE